MMNLTASTKIGGIRVKSTIVLAQHTLPANGTAGFITDDDMWVVLNPGEILQALQQPSGTVNYIVSGYLLYI